MIRLRVLALFAVAALVTSGCASVGPMTGRHDAMAGHMHCMDDMKASHAGQPDGKSEDKAGAKCPMMKPVDDHEHPADHQH